MGEQRALQRFDLNISAIIQAEAMNPEEEVLQLLTSNICSGGAYFRTDRPLAAGRQVRVDLILPLDKLTKAQGDIRPVHIRVTGTVLRVEAGGMAVRFNEDYEMRPLQED